MNEVIITGASRGLGASTTRQCAKRSMGVIATYTRNGQAAERVVDSIAEEGGKAVALERDVAKAATFRAFAEMVRLTLKEVCGRETFGFLVNNAGYGLCNPIATVSEEEFDGLYAVHLKGPFFLTQTLLPLMVDSGQVVNVGSAPSRAAAAGWRPTPVSRAASRC